MPKEMTHFKVARMTAEILANTSYAPSLAAHPEGLLLGAVLHDSFFYAVSADKEPLERLGHIFHGAKGEDSYRLIRMQARLAMTGNELAKAVLVGMISHMYADVTMHPLVYHFTGNYYHKSGQERSLARQRHRAFETILDMAACPEMIGKRDFLIAALLKSCPAFIKSGLPIEALAQATSLSQSTTRTFLEKTWGFYGRMQHLNTLRPLAFLFNALRPWLPKGAAEIAPLFYGSQFNTHVPFLSDTIHYQHPVTGEHHTSTLNQLITSAATSAANFCKEITPVLEGDTPVSSISGGATLDAGIPDTGVDAMRHFATPLFPPLSHYI